MDAGRVSLEHSRGDPFADGSGQRAKAKGNMT